MKPQLKKMTITVVGFVLCQLFLTACTSNTVDKLGADDGQNVVQSLLKGTSLNISSVDDGLLKGTAAIQEGKMDLAQLYYIKAYDLEPDNIQVLQKMTDLYMQLEKYTLAEESLKMMLKVEPTNLIALNDYGLLLLKEKKYPEAKLILERVIVKKAEWKAYNGLGIIANLQGDMKQAEFLFKKADSIFPNSPEILNNVGFSLFSLGELNEALLYYNKALQINPDFKKALYNYALLEARLNNYDDAYNAFVKASTAAEANNNLGYITMMKGDYVRANDYLQTAIKLSPQFYKKANDNLNQLERLENGSDDASNF